MPVRRASDIMIQVADYPTIPPHFTLRTAIALIEDSTYDLDCANGRTSLPRVLLVVDKERGLVGLIRRRDILRGLEPSFSPGAPPEAGRRAFFVAADPNLSELTYDHLLRQMRTRAGRTIREFMIPIPVTVDADDHIFKVVQQMVSCNTSLVPVMSGRQVVGVVRSVDVLHEVARMITEEGGEA